MYSSMNTVQTQSVGDLGAMQHISELKFSRLCSNYFNLITDYLNHFYFIYLCRFKYLSEGFVVFHDIKHIHNISSGLHI